MSELVIVVVGVVLSAISCAGAIVLLFYIFTRIESIGLMFLSTALVFSMIAWGVSAVLKKIADCIL